MQRIFAMACVMLCSFLAVPALAQRTIRGTIYDNDNETLPGVSVVIKEKPGIGALTDNKGHYSLSLPNDNKEYTIAVSYIGYGLQNKKLKPNQSEDINFYLKEDEVNLDVVVITGTRTPKLLKDSPIITKVITEHELKKIDATNIGDLLQSELPGIEFSYSMGQQVSLNMQGFGGNAVLFLIDGERVAGETLDNIDYSRLNLDNVERIEIIKGAASSLYGSNAVGGVVNIISKTPNEPWEVNLNARVGTHNDQRHGGTVSFHTGKVANTLNVQYVSTDGYNLINKNPKESSDTTRVYGNRSWNIKERLQYTMNDQITLTGHASFFFRERDIKDRYRAYTGGIKGNFAINESNNLELAYYFDQYDKSDYYIATNTDVRDYSNVQNSVRALYNYSFGEKNALTIGGDYMRDYLMSYQFQDNGSFQQHVADIFAQLDWTIAGNFNIITGLRYDYFSDNDISRVSPKVGLMQKLGNFTLRGSYAAGFRAPTLKEKYMVFDMANVFMIYGNENLKPESSQNFSISGEFTKSYYNFTLTGYYNLVDNRISTVWSQERKGMLYSNIENIKISGMDANASARFPCGISARLSYTFTHESFGKGKVNLSDTRPHSATARIEYDKSWNNYGINISLTGRYLSKLNTNVYTTDYASGEVERVSYPGYSIWKLSCVQNISNGINITVGVDNLFDHTPSVYSGNSPYTAGREFSAGISLDIHKLFRK